MSIVGAFDVHRRQRVTGHAAPPQSAHHGDHGLMISVSQATLGKRKPVTTVISGT